MGNKHRVEKPFKYFSWGENPIGKYAQPKKNDDSTGTGYPQTGIDNDDVLVKGRFMKGTKKKKLMEMKGAGAAEKGTKFHINEKRFSVED